MKKINELKKNGFFVIKASLSPQKIDHLLGEVDKLIEELGDTSCAPPVGIQKSIATDPILNNIHYLSNDFLDLVINGEQVELIRQVLNDPYYGLIPEDQPNFTLAQCNLRKSSSSLDYHVDVRLKIPFSEGSSIQCIIALEDRNRNNGGLKVISGSHLSSKVEAKELDFSSEKFVDLQAGDMVIFWSHLYHGTTGVSLGHNPAWGLLLTYRSWWCKPQFNFVEMFQERFADLDFKTKTLLGYHSQPSSSWNGSASARQGYLSKPGKVI